MARFDSVPPNRGVANAFAQLADIDDTFYVVAGLVEFGSKRRRDVLVTQKRHLYPYDSGRSSGPVVIRASSCAAV